MKKPIKVKAGKTKRSARSSDAPVMPGLVEALAKLVERLESVERKVDQVLGRVSNQPQVQHAHPPERSVQVQNQEVRKERVMYQAICADCQKNCQVPFKPGSRPVYCKECFAIRKAGHAPKDLSGPSVILNPERLQKYQPSQMDYTPPPRKKSASGGVAVMKGKLKTKKKKRK